MQDDTRDREIETILARYRPLTPPPGLRERVVSAAPPSRLDLRVWAIAAGLLVSLLAQSLAGRAERRTEQLLSLGASAVSESEIQAALSVAPLDREALRWRLAPSNPQASVVSSRLDAARAMLEPGGMRDEP